MRKKLVLLPVILLFFFVSCKREGKAAEDCFTTSATVRQISNQPATIKAAGGKFYIVEQGAIDTRLDPCNLQPQFRIDNLPVTVSGIVKSGTDSSGPCCTENFVITSITR